MNKTPAFEFFCGKLKICHQSFDLFRKVVKGRTFWVNFGPEGNLDESNLPVGPKIDQKQIYLE